MKPTSLILRVATYAITRLAENCCRVFAFRGEDMAHTTTTQTAPMPEPITTLADIDEALLWTALTGPRDDHWHRWLDALLDQRNHLAKTTQPSQPTRP